MAASHSDSPHAAAPRAPVAAGQARETRPLGPAAATSAGGDNVKPPASFSVGVNVSGGGQLHAADEGDKTPLATPAAIGGEATGDGQSSAQLVGSPIKALYATTAAFFVGFAAVALFGPTALELKDVMDLSATQVGLLVAAPSLSGSLLRVPFGAWVDADGGRTPILVLLLMAVVGMAGLLITIVAAYPDGLRDNTGAYPGLFCLGVLAGCGIATFSPGIGLVSYWFPQKEQGQRLGFYAGVGNLAPGLFSVLIPLALSSLELAGSYAVWLAILIIGTAVFWWWGQRAFFFQAHNIKHMRTTKAIRVARSAGQELFPKGTAMAALNTAARTWRTWALVGIYFTTFGGFLAATGWMPTYWRVYFDLEPRVAGGLTALYSMLSSAVRVHGGVLADKVGGATVLLVSLGVTAIGAALLALSDTVALSIVGEVLMGGGMGYANAATFKLMPKYVPSAVGGAAGWIGGLGAFGGFAIPPVLGAIAGAGEGEEGYAAGWWVMCGLSVLAFALAVVLQRADAAEGSGRLEAATAAPVPRPVAGATDGDTGTAITIDQASTLAPSRELALDPTHHHRTSGPPL